MKLIEKLGFITAASPNVVMESSNLSVVIFGDIPEKKKLGD